MSRFNYLCGPNGKEKKKVNSNVWLKTLRFWLENLMHVIGTFTRSILFLNLHFDIGPKTFINHTWNPKIVKLKKNRNIQLKLIHNNEK